MDQKPPTLPDGPPEPNRQARRRPRRHARLHPPLIALIDVMFTLLLFFVTTCQSRQDEGELPTTLPTFVGGPGQAGGRIVPEIRVRVRHVGYARDDARDLTFEKVSFWLPRIRAGSIESEQGLYEALAGMRKTLGAADAAVIIEADETISWEALVQAFNQAARAEFRNISFAYAS